MTETTSAAVLRSAAESLYSAELEKRPFARNFDAYNKVANLASEAERAELVAKQKAELEAAGDDAKARLAFDALKANPKTEPNYRAASFDDLNHITKLELILATNAKPYEYKVGDRVRVTKSNRTLPLGTVAEVRGTIDGDGDLWVRPVGRTHSYVKATDVELHNGPRLFASVDDIPVGVVFGKAVNDGKEYSKHDEGHWVKKADGSFPFGYGVGNLCTSDTYGKRASGVQFHAPFIEWKDETTKFEV